MIKKLLVLVFITSFSISFSQETYYDDVDLTLSGIELKEELAAKMIASHTNILEYTSGRPDTWDASKATDENTSNTSEVVLFYGWENGSDGDESNDRTRDKNLQDSGTGASFVWNREHVFPKSLANPPLNTNVPGPSTDAHHLRAADRTRNSSRNNKKYGNGSGNSAFSSETFAGLDGPNTNAWYPGDEWKGDAARMIMYMYVHYGDVCLPTVVGIGNNQFTPDNMIDLFLKWNVEDPVSQIEKDRNTYHEDTSNGAAQGNRNPFIDNPYLATRIWGGDSAEDLWGNYTGSDTEAPTQPTALLVSNETTTTFDLNWTASTDNIEVTGYYIYVDDLLTAQTTNTNFQLTGLSPETSYAIQIEARDLINNKSEKSDLVNNATTADTTAPSVPTNFTATNISATAFKVNWEAATDDTAVTEYTVYVDGTLEANTADVNYTLTGLTASTTYQITISAKDAANNVSAQSTAFGITTTDGGSNGIEELFISEYVEGTGNNKAIEIVNLTAISIDLSAYDLRRNGGGGSSWSDPFYLDSGAVQNILPNDVFVIINPQADNSFLIAEADLLTDVSVGYGVPLSFNGDDPVGLFKNGNLIDIIGEFNGNNGEFAKDITLRRKATTSSPNINYNRNEWDAFEVNTFDGIGSHTATLSIENDLIESFKMYPNPTAGKNLYFKITKDIKVAVYTVLGKRIKTEQISVNKSNMDISSLSKGIYFLKITSENKSITQKFIKR